MTQTLDRFHCNIQRLDRLYRESPTAQMLVNNAPAILQYFREAKALALQHQHDLDLLMQQQKYDLEKFRVKAPAIIAEIRLVSNEIRSLQRFVREKAASIGDDPQARIVINHTNDQIAQQISIFNNLALTFMNA